MARGHLIAPLLLIGCACEAATTLTSSPATVALCPDGVALVRLVGTDADAPDLSKLGVQWQTTSNAVIKLRDAAEAGTSGPGYAAWLLEVGASAEQVRPGVVHVFLVDKSSAPPKLRASASFDVQSGFSDAKFPAALTFDSASERINEGQRARVHVLVTNESRRELFVSVIRLSAGPFMVAGGDPRAPLEKNSAGEFLLPVELPSLPPGGALMQAADVYLDHNDRAAAGMHRLRVAADLREGSGSCARGATLTAQKDLGFAVIGNDAIVTVIGIPSFLLAPGFLFLSTMALLWKLGLKPRSAAPTAEFWLPVKGTEFWLVAVTLSLPVALLPKLLGIFANYRIEDVAVVWLVCLIAGVLAHLGIVSGLNRLDASRKAAAALAAAAANARIVSVNDSAIAALTKIRDARDTVFRQFTVDLTKAAAGTGTANLLAAQSTTDGGWWVIPPVVYELKGVDAGLSKCIEDARNGRRFGELVDALIAASGKGQVVVKWRNGAVQRPLAVKTGEFTENGAAELVSAV